MTESAGLAGRSVDDGYRLSEEERLVYRLMAYFFVAWPLLAFVARHFLPEHLSGPVTAFVVMLGIWFVNRPGRLRIPLAVWFGLSLAAGVAGYCVGWAFDRLWPVV